jgi:hypothetical protein
MSAAAPDVDGVLSPICRTVNHPDTQIDPAGFRKDRFYSDPTSFESFPSRERNAFNGLCLAIVRAKPGQTGTITLKAESEGLGEAAVVLQSKATE